MLTGSLQVASYSRPQKMETIRFGEDYCVGAGVVLGWVGTLASTLLEEPLKIQQISSIRNAAQNERYMSGIFDNKAKILDKK